MPRRFVPFALLALLRHGGASYESDSHTSGDRVCGIEDLVGPQYPVPVDILEGVEVTLEFSRCKQAQQCRDGSFVSGRRCDGTKDCADLSDEDGCTEEEKAAEKGKAPAVTPDDVKVSSATMALVALMEKYPDMIKGKRVLELGSGMGIASLAAMKLGAKLVVATDGSMEAAEHASHTLHSNKRDRRRTKVHSLRLRWGDADDIAHAAGLAKGRGYDVVIGADLLKPPKGSAAPVDDIATTWNALAHKRSALLLVTEPWEEGLNDQLTKALSSVWEPDGDATKMDVLKVVTPTTVSDPLLPKSSFVSSKKDCLQGCPAELLLLDRSSHAGVGELEPDPEEENELEEPDEPEEPEESHITDEPEDVAGPSEGVPQAAPLGDPLEPDVRSQSSEVNVEENGNLVQDYAGMDDDPQGELVDLDAAQEEEEEDTVITEDEEEEEGEPVSRAEGCVHSSPCDDCALKLELFQGKKYPISLAQCESIQKCDDWSLAGGRRCDGHADCADGSDEDSCDSIDKIQDSELNFADERHSDKLSPAALALAALFEKHPELVRDKTVLELGCGSGVASLAAVKKGASFVFATDGSLEAVEQAAYNVQSNMSPTEHQRVAFTSQQLRWGNQEDIEAANTLMSGEGFDVFIAADVLFGATGKDKSTMGQLVKTWNALANQKSVLIMVSIDRRETDSKDAAHTIEMAELLKWRTPELDSTTQMMDMEEAEIVTPRVIKKSTADGLPIMPSAIAGSKLPPLHLLLLDRGAAAQQKEAEEKMRSGMKVKEDL